jgi:tetratricopeptide (TPR) repeat protein
MNIEAVLSRYYWLAVAALLLITISFSVNLKVPELSTPDKAFFVPAPEYVERLSGTFRGVVALVFYMKGAQELAYATEKKTDRLLALFRVALRLDSNLLQAAFLGGMVAPSRAKDIPKAIDLLKEAESLKPEEWKIPYWIGFNYAQISEYEKAAEYYTKASKLPGALPFLGRASVAILAQGDSLQPAILETERMLAAAIEEEYEEGDYEWLLMRLDWLKTMQMLENKNFEFKSLKGSFPEDLPRLLEEGLLEKLPDDEFGGGFYLVNPGDPEEGYRVRSSMF